MYTMGSSPDEEYDEELMFESSATTTVHELAVASELSDEDKDLRHRDSADDSTSESDYDYNDKDGVAFRAGTKLWTSLICDVQVV
jgi:hypothetical protein